MTGSPVRGRGREPAADAGTFDLLPEAVVVVDRDLTIRTVNERARNLLGVQRAAVGEPLPEVLELFDDTGERVSDRLLPEQRLGDRLPERLLRVRLSDGWYRPVSIAGRLIDGGAVLTFRNAGRRERLDAARSDLIATVSHEIRSPLTSVKGFTRTMLVKWERFSDEQKRQMLATINADADRVTRLLTELLDVARIDAGRVQLHRLVTDLPPIIERVIDKLTHHHDEDREITLETSRGLPPVYVDPDKLEQVVTNLVENALQYAPGSPVRVGVGEQPETVEIEVTDQGPGIPPDQLRQIFGKFARGRGIRRTGTGLGLYITKGLVEAHGGRVWAESDVGDGATFRVLLPKGGIELAFGDRSVGPA
ncbi:MAG TPA: ATP-binding protein [Nitriliruptorales bacterium]|nr:ATP-binding protein [Nitriliruptorales bacterium]